VAVGCEIGRSEWKHLLVPNDFVGFRSAAGVKEAGMGMKSTKLFGMGLLIGMFASATAFAVPVSQGGAFFVSSSPIYDGTLQVWDIFEAMLNSGSVKNASGVGNRFIFSSNDSAINKFTWTGNTLNQDLTVVGEELHGLFNGGGTLSVFGTLRNAAFPNGQVAGAVNTLILQANVSGFELQEEGANTGIISSTNQFITFTPTGGYLYTNSILQLNGTYRFALTGAVVEKLSGGDVENFSDDIKSMQAFQINYDLVPEPASLMFMGCCIMAFSFRKRCSVGS
jgi:hypothetical protein